MKNDGAMVFYGKRPGTKFTAISNGRCEVHLVMEYRGLVVHNWRVRVPSGRVHWLSGWWLPMKLSGVFAWWMLRNARAVQAKMRATDELMAVGILPPDGDEMARFEKS